MTNFTIAGATEYYKEPIPREVGKDEFTGEKIYRQKTFVKTRVPGKALQDINSSIESIDEQVQVNIRDKQAHVGVSMMLLKADLLGTRGIGKDREQARNLLEKMVLLSTGTPGQIAGKIRKLGITEAEQAAFDDVEQNQKRPITGMAYIGYADLALKQLSDSEKPHVSLDKAIEYCQSGRTELWTAPADEKNHFLYLKSFVIEARLMALRGDSESAITKKLDQAQKDWKTLEALCKDNRFITGNKRPSGTKPEDNLEETRKGIVFVASWADVERAKLTSQTAKVSKAKEAEFEKKLLAAMVLCDTAMSELSKIGKQSEYVYNDAMLTKADLMAKLARLKDDREMLGKAKDLYLYIANNVQFNDLKALAIAGRISADVELGSFTVDDAKTALETYFDSAVGANNLRHPFDRKSYSYLAIELLEAQLRNLVSRKKVVVPGGTSHIPAVNTQVPDYTLSECRTGHVVKYIDKVEAVRDRQALVEGKARAMLEHAKAVSLRATASSDRVQKIKEFDEATKELDAILTMLKETEADILSNTGERKMEGSFYVSLWETKANLMEQMAWTANTDVEDKNLALFEDAKKKYQDTKKLCAWSKAVYDKGVNGEPSARQKLIDLSIANLDIAKQNIDIAAGTSGQISETIKKLDDLISDLDKFKAPGGLTDLQKEKLLVNVQRMKMEALSKKLIYIFKQKTELLAAAGITNRAESIKTLYKSIIEIANKIMPEDVSACKLDDTYYPVMSLFGVSSIYMGLINKEEAANNIIKFYSLYVKQFDRTITYDMLDALANSVVALKDDKRAKTLTSNIRTTLDTLIKDNLGGGDDKKGVTLAKVYAWRARIANWMFNAKTGDISELEGAQKDYEAALALHAKVRKTESREALFTNGPTTLTLKEEYQTVCFAATQKRHKAVNAAKARFGEFAKELAYFKGIIDAPATSAEGLSPETVKILANQDSAAKIKARVMAASIVMSLVDPIADTERTGVKLEDAVKVVKDSNISSAVVENGNSIFGIAATIFDEAIAKATGLGLTDAQLQGLGVDIQELFTKREESYLNLTSKDDKRTEVSLARLDKGIALVQSKGYLQATGKLTILKAQLIFWKKGNRDEAIGIFENAFKIMTGKSVAELVASKFEGLSGEDLAVYADIMAIAAYQSDKYRATAVVAMDAAISKITDKTSQKLAQAKLRKAEYLAVISNETDNRDAANKNHIEAIGLICEALDILQKTTFGTDVNKHLTYYEGQDANKKDVVASQPAMEAICMLVESKVRLYNTEIDRVPDKQKRWNDEVALVRRGKRVLARYLASMGVLNAKMVEEKKLKTYIASGTIKEADMTAAEEKLSGIRPIILNSIGNKWDARKLIKMQLWGLSLATSGDERKLQTATGAINFVDGFQEGDAPKNNKDQ